MTLTFGLSMVPNPISFSCSHSSYASTRRLPNVVGCNVRSSTNRRWFKSGLCTNVHDLILTPPLKPQDRIWIPKATASDESTPVEPSENTETRPATKITLEDIPKKTLHELTLKGHKQKKEVVIGSKGLGTGAFTSILQHLNRRDVIRVKVSKACKVEAAEIAKDLEQRSGGLIIFQAGAKMILYKGELLNEVPPEDIEQDQNE